ncbi:MULTISPECIES: 2-succinyl-6-hydroxy-2,4-cyclohexadiene-1-carboxylate synthase [Brenneria]|uniref:2-succinyl-6-hydroxy-2,4-cyclohexadiene-1-carboxylate synthase n=1 Tax=Brenneria nigrifluens DSM 30175 = ATCC 13028 TaxID=1121120 RepID=A0A2U1UWP7_9GAMM|nr:MULTISPECIES: 2-succinyl-6-hydroxy-2,4-cyclohexadiene-1-carboxylate synthase [Brenneria]EHD22590.1 2-succinyl-6-hydroxy-2,4-cyclohexadiene-1-carboxylate synthase [Brenneria sp. EniD312]PWC26040.1 2-succinyl-6-hydroxy-2,4-cyclohexadiene-1-carboxylate synthase [Brenneria nigrifluens DSM 30175 = ATCC 13028]QCR06985.1 2-succinyl-6-hydroxy-2,4-cyclohexadiene-1-carboxylate synthase [Brenneria nigrifluens DSM 30175 = ATCC 13028]
MLHCRKIAPAEGSPARPWLVCLHGLLGSGEDWQPIAPFFNDWPLLLVDLPGHGGSLGVTPGGFAQVSELLSATLRQQGIEEYLLLGYSLGGRIAMYHACCGQPRGMRGLLAEGGHPGLAQPRLREQRLLHDAGWARRLRHEPMAAVLNDWYRQAVFADLNAAQRAGLVALRRLNYGPAVADMLEATSLGRQPWLGEKLRQLAVPFAYLCGAADAKFQALAAQYNLPLLSVARAGHNAHQANPAEYAARILSFLSHPVKD